MNSLDSRSLRFGDTFTQLFPKSGRVSYSIDFAARGKFRTENKYHIEVKKTRERTPAQHNVVVRLKDGVLVPEPSSLEIGLGDRVLWSAADNSVPGFTVSGESAAGEFDSSALSEGSVYTHPFGLPGDYTWIDANGSKVSGVVSVTVPKLELQRDVTAYQKRLTTGAVFIIDKAKVEPSKVEIMVGQTVFWVIKKAGGITITDRQLIQQS